MQPLRFARGPETSAAPRALDIRDISTSAQRNVVSTWVTSPLTAAAFVPRLYTGALAKGPAIVSELAETIGDTSNALQDSALTTAEKQVCGTASACSHPIFYPLSVINSTVSSCTVLRSMFCSCANFDMDSSAPW